MGNLRTTVPSPASSRDQPAPERPATPRLFLPALLLLVLAHSAFAQVGSATGQANGSGQKPGSPPSAQSPSLTTSKPLQPPPTQTAASIPVKTELGTLGEAMFRIDVPQNWNHSLVIYYHGYESKPHLYTLADGKPRPPSRILQQVLDRGYAIAQSGYSTGGWAVDAAFKETEDLRRYFTQKYSAPRETLVMGHSMGGLLTVMTLERRPDAYAGGLALCGVLAPADLVMQRAFANRVAFDAFFPGILPPVDKIPDTFAMNDLPTIAAVQKALDAKPDSAALIRSLADIHTNRGLADVLVFNTFVIKDLALKTGGNPFDNRNLIYTGTTDDYTLNAQVKRFAADAKSVRYMGQFYSPTGLLKRKLLAVHTTYDPLVPAATAAWYDEATRRSGVGDLFVQKYVNRDGHCNITAEQTGEAFDQLLAWVHQNRRPPPGLLAEAPPVAPAKQTPQPQPKSPPKNIGKPQ